jgi:bacteriocin biosynthesis cyclodehydratase domain-containing protein
VSGPRYRLRPSIEPFVDRHGELCLVRPGGQDLVVRRPEDADVALLRELQNTWATAEHLARRVGVDPSVVQRKLDSLAAADVVVLSSGPPAPPLNGEDAERFLRQMPYLAELGDDVRLQRRLRDSSVAVVGCGGLGTWAIAALACIGVGRMVLIDDDRVALSNLNRQILYSRADMGAAKVVAAAEWVRAFDPAIRVNAVDRRIASVEDVTAIIFDADAVVLAADWPPYEIGRWVNAACVRAGTPFIVAGQLPPLLKVGPTYVPGNGPCFTCHETALARASRSYEDYVAFRGSEPIATPTLGPGSCVVGGMIGVELLHLLAGHMPSTHGVAVLVNMRTMAVRHERVERDPACATCKHLADGAGRG